MDTSSLIDKGQEKMNEAIDTLQSKGGKFLEAAGDTLKKKVVEPIKEDVNKAGEKIKEAIDKVQHKAEKELQIEREKAEDAIERERVKMRKLVKALAEREKKLLSNHEQQQKQRGVKSGVIFFWPGGITCLCLSVVKAEQI